MLFVKCFFFSHFKNLFLTYCTDHLFVPVYILSDVRFFLFFVFVFVSVCVSVVFGHVAKLLLVLQKCPAGFPLLKTAEVYNVRIY